MKLMGILGLVKISSDLIFPVSPGPRSLRFTTFRRSRLSALNDSIFRLFNPQFSSVNLKDYLSLRHIDVRNFLICPPACRYKSRPQVFHQTTDISLYRRRIHQAGLASPNGAQGAWECESRREKQDRVKLNYGSIRQDSATLFVYLFSGRFLVLPGWTGSHA